MTIAPSTPSGPAVTAGPDDAAVFDVTVLLPTREDLLVRLDETLPTARRWPITLLIVGLLRRDDGWPTPRPRCRPSCSPATRAPPRSPAGA
jgi:hypothetical protein